MSKHITAAELVKFAEGKIGTAYVYGMKGKVMTDADFMRLYNSYGSPRVPYSDKSKVGKVCVDCSGLISWATGIVRNSQSFHDLADEVHPIKTINNAPVGAAVWLKGHIGIYVGNGEYIAADGSAVGCRRNKLSRAKFTHWFKIIDVEYPKEDDEVVENAKIVIDGKEYPAKRILKDGTNYVKLRDLADLLGYNITSKGSIAVLTKK